MPVFKITAPDGRVFNVTAPEGATKEDALKRVQADHRRQKLSSEMTHTESSPSLPHWMWDMPTSERLAAGVGKGMVDTWRGVKQMTGNMTQAEVDEAKRVDAPLMQTGAGKLGAMGGMVTTALPLMAVPGAGTVPGSAAIGGVLGATQPVSEGESRLANTGLGLFGGMGGNLGARGAGRYASNKIDAKAQEAAQSSVRDSTIRGATDAGYTLPPTHANPSAPNRFLEGFAGKLTTEQQSAVKNQAVTNRLARKALGMAESDDLTPSSLAAIRKTAGKEYDELARVGRVKLDGAFREELLSAAGGNLKLAAEFPSQANPKIKRVLNDLIRPGGTDIKGVLGSQSRELDSGNIVRLVRQLRRDAKKNLSSMDNPSSADLGRFQRKAADALENLIERNITDPNGIDAFKNARQLIAKTHEVESALNAAGDVSARAIAKSYEKGSPMTGELETIGKTASLFKKATQDVGSGFNTLSPFDFAASSVLWAGTGDPLSMAAWMVGRPATRAAILSKPYQSMMVQPSHSARSAEVIRGLLDNPAGRALPGPLGASLGLLSGGTN